MSEYSANIDGVFIGDVTKIGPEQTPTGIYKNKVVGAQRITELGLVGDIQVDRRVHGGPEKAVYHFPAENYAVCQQALPHLKDAFIPGSIGENISSTGVDDKTVHIGDILRLGTALVQVSQPRRPCWKVNHKYGNGHLASLLMSQGISGWYYRILEEGVVSEGDQWVFCERLDNSLSVYGVWRMFLERLQSRMPPEAFSADIPGLSREWRFQ